MKILRVLALICFIIGCTKKTEQPPVVVTGTVTEITPTSAIINGNTYSTDYSIWCEGICWSNINSRPYLNDWPNTVQTENWSRADLTTNNFSLKLTDLTPGTTYYAWAWVQNTIGTGFGDFVSFSTTGSIKGDIRFNSNLVYRTITDSEGNIYKAVQIGTQTWMAENLKTTKYNDGTPIPNVTDRWVWDSISSPGYCWYLNDESYKNTFGALYNWYTVISGKLCPNGWHIPENDEWMQLKYYLGIDNDVSAGQLMETDTIHWVATPPPGTNSSGFTALPGGWINELGIHFGGLGYTGMFWSRYPYPDDLNPDYIVKVVVGWNCNEGICLNSGGGSLGNVGYSVRCIKD